MMKKGLLELARLPFVGRWIAFVAQYAPVLIPGRKIARTENMLLLHHPVPSYEKHGLILPRKRVKSILDVKDPRLFGDMVAMAERFLAGQGKEQALMLCVNGGRRQDVRQLHGHVVPAKDERRYMAGPGEPVIFETEKGWVTECGGAYRAGKKEPPAESPEGWMDLFSVARAFLQMKEKAWAGAPVGFSLRMIKRPGETGFQPWIWMEIEGENAGKEG